MPELPEMVIIASQMAETLRGKVFEQVVAFQPKCLNRLEREYRLNLPGKEVLRVEPLGKWVEISLNQGTRLLLSLGMGGEICYLEPEQFPPEKTRFLARFTDRSGFYITLWWFGYIHLVLPGERHPMTDNLGPDPLQLSNQAFFELLDGRRGTIKSFLLDQKRIRGIGNFYIQEILFQARLHPLREIPSLSLEEKQNLYQAIQTVLTESIELGSSSYELDFFGQKGHYGLDNISFAYKENAICPSCGSVPQKLKTGSISQFICPECQRLP